MISGSDDVAHSVAEGETRLSKQRETRPSSQDQSVKAFNFINIVFMFFLYFF